MKNYTVTQKILSIGATYSISPEGSEEVIMTVKGAVLTFTPRLEALKNDSVVASMKGNFFKTSFTITDASGAVLGDVTFPFFNFIKGFTLKAGDSTYNAKGGFFARRFTCQDEAGNEMISIKKEFALRDRFRISLGDGIDETVGLLSAVCIDQRYFQG
jgi:uncharacterized protein YxjI